MWDDISLNKSSNAELIQIKSRVEQNFKQNRELSNIEETDTEQLVTEFEGENGNFSDVDSNKLIIKNRIKLS